MENSNIPEKIKARNNNLQKRIDYVKKQINKSKNTEKKIKTLARRFFVTERTIENYLLM